MLSNRYKRVQITDIRVNREQRQRGELDLNEGFLNSIKRNGVINPIIVTKDLVLVAGERRLTASAQLGLPDIPVRFAEDLPPIEAQIIELEENLKREDLGWRDLVKAIQRIHNLYIKIDPEWTLGETATQLNVTTGNISMYLRVAAEIDSPKLLQAGGVREAFNILARRDERAIGDAMSEIMETTLVLTAPKTPTSDGVVVTLHAPAQPKILPADQSILNESFLKWAPQYSGPKFNFIHCDFPYGMNVFAGPQAQGKGQQIYDDSPDTYWQLVKCLCENLDRVLAHSGHLMFWLSNDIERQFETIQKFKILSPSLDFNLKPLVWMKSDNAGVLADPNRGPRNIVETAIFASREDRFIVKAKANAYSAPTDKSHHTSAKPEPMLRFFFEMFVDDTTSLLDPTCGSGSALRAAESLGAKHVLGLEIDPESCGIARSALKQFRVLRSAAK